MINVSDESTNKSANCLPATTWMPTVCAHRCAQRIEWTSQQQINLLCRRNCSNSDRAQAVDGRLQNNTSDGGNGKLQPHRYAHTTKNFHTAWIPANAILSHTLFATYRRNPFSSPAPNRCATGTTKPLHTPLQKPMIKKLIEPVAPTPASALKIVCHCQTSVIQTAFQAAAPSPASSAV